MKRLRVLHVIPSVGPLRGGPSEHVRSLCAALAAMGVDAALATTDDNGPGRLEVPLGSACEENGYTTFYFPRQIREYAVSFPLASWLRRNVASYDCAHIHALLSFAPTMAAHYARRAGVPYLLSTHGILQDWGFSKRRKHLKWLSLQLNEKRMVRNAYAILFNSETERIETQAKVEAKNVAVIPHGLNIDEYEGMPASKWLRDKYPEIGKKRVVLFMSRLHDNKGIELLLNAWAVTGTKEAILVIAGDGEEGYIKYLKRLASFLKVDAIWTGHLGGEEKISVLHEADLFVLPSWSESFGISVIEAMACGVPVLVSEKVGVSCDVARAKAGMVVPCDIEKLAEALSTLLGDNRLRERMGRCGKRFARERYDMKRIAGEVMRVYEMAVGDVR